MLKNQIHSSVRDMLLELANQRAYCRYSGEYTEMLSLNLKQLVGASDCLLASSGTAALEIALRAGGVGPGHEVILAGYDYPGNFWAVERVGARPVLVDIEPDGWCLATEQVESAIQSSDGRKCKALIASHLHGQLQDAFSLRRLCDAYEILFIEDGCQAIGAALESGMVGSAGHAAILSFGGGKLLSAGRGGALLSSDDGLSQRARLAAGAGSGPYAMSEMQAATVVAQLEWLPQLLQVGREFFACLHCCILESLDQDLLQFTMPSVSCVARMSYYQAGWLVRHQGNSNSDQASLASVLTRCIAELRAAGIPAGKGFDGFHRRSVRRCRIPHPLVNTIRAVGQTLLIHHDASLDASCSPQHIAATLNSALL